MFGSIFSKIAAAVLFLPGFMLFCCGLARAESGKPQLLPADKAPLLIVTDKGKQIFTAEIARTDAEKQRGLMYRRIFPRDRAMLFVFAPEEKVIAMWMDKTPLPLDMVFADKQGKIVTIYPNAAPFSRNLISSLYPVSYVAELNAGEAAARGLEIGQKMRHPIICGPCG